jgi:uncharacterized protein (DUF1697 family)
MAVYVALIRAIGPVTHARMKMAALKAACEAAGFADVSTVGNTGNIVFRSDGTEAEVRKLAQGAVGGFGLGEANEVFIDTPARMAAVVKANPFPSAAAERPSEVGVSTFHKAPDWSRILDWDGPEKLATVGPHLIVEYQAITGSRLRIEKSLGVTMTQRNWKVFAALAGKAAALAKD